MKHRRIKKQVYVVGAILLLVIVLSIFGIRYLIYRGTNEYKLKKLGYETEEIAVIEKLESDKIQKVLEKDYNPLIPKLLKEKYFMFQNLEFLISSFAYIPSLSRNLHSLVP